MTPGFLVRILRGLFPPVAEAVAELRPGVRARVRGRVVPRDLLESPLEAAPCVYYRVLVEEMRPSVVTAVTMMGGGGFWTVVEQDEAIAEFYLEDPAGDRVLIAPARAEVEATLPAWQRPTASRRQAELVIRPDDPVVVDGIVEEVEDIHGDGRGYRDARVRLVIAAPAGEPLLIRRAPVEP